MQQGNKIFYLDGILGRAAHGEHPNSRKWGLDKRQVAAWKEGMTGVSKSSSHPNILKQTIQSLSFHLSSYKLLFLLFQKNDKLYMNVHYSIHLWMRI